MKGFYIEVSNNLLDPRHCKQMGDSVWLFMWFLDKMTVITQEKGKVLGGKPIKYSDIEDDLGISRSTYNRWMNTLREGGYVQTVRTPYGSCIVVLKAKKRFSKPITDDSKMEHLITSVKSESSLAPDMNHQSSDSDTSVRQKRHISAPEMTHVIKTRAVDSTVDNSIDNTFRPPVDGSFLVDQLVSDQSDNSGKLINDAIALFLPLLPGDFVGKQSAFAKPPTRKAVQALLERYDLDQIRELIRKYDEGKEDQYRPQVGTVYEFCTVKLAKIEAFVGKKTGNKLWAQRSISTPEQSRVRDEQYQKIIDAGREKRRLAKDEWLKEHPEEN